MSIENAGAVPEVELKDLGALEIKNEEKGEVEAVIATLGVVDKDGDIITAGAIKSGSKVTMSRYGHDAIFGAMPVGKGTLHIDGDKAIFKGKMFLSTSTGREVFNVLKEMGADQQWSFGFRVKGAEVPDDDARAKGADRILTKLDAFEVSPVLEGAGVGTHTLAMKEAKKIAAAEEKAAEPEAEPVEEAPADPVEPETGTTDVTFSADSLTISSTDEAKDAEPEADEIEAKRLEAERAESERVEAELKAAAEDEFERFQRTLRRFAA